MSRDLPPMGFIERLQRINTNALKLCADQPLKQIGTYSLGSFRQDDSAVTSRHVIKFCAQIALNQWRAGTSDAFTYASAFRIDEFKTLVIWGSAVGPIKIGGHLATTKHQESAARRRRRHVGAQPAPIKE